MRQIGLGVGTLLLLCAAAFGQTAAPQGSGPSAPDAWLPRTSADLILLDKLRNQPTPVSIRAGQSAAFGSLTVTLRSCVVRPPDLPQNSAAFLDITDSRGTTAPFHGWVIANAPAVAQFEHPIYDLRLVTCR